MSSRPSPSLLRKLLSYDPDTGVLTWRKRPRSMFKSDRIWRTWNTRYADNPAGNAGWGGYHCLSIFDQPYGAHRLAWVLATGRWPVKVIDHINGVTGDNRLENLRAVTHQDNLRNAALSSLNTSGVTGVYYDKERSKWAAQMVVSGNNLHLGRFKTKQEAILSRKSAERKYGFHHNHGRPPVR